MKFLHLIDRATAKTFGLKLYFTGKACRRGHLSERYTSGYSCVTCVALSVRTNNKKEYDRNYYLSNRGKIVSRVASRLCEFPEKVKAEGQRTYRKHHTERLSKVRKYKNSNLEKVKQRDRLYRLTNPEMIAANKRRRKAAKKQRRVGWGRELTDFVDFEAGHLCKLREASTGLRWEVDHIIPLQGKTVSGLHIWHNLEVIPAYINLRKNANFWYTEPYSWRYFT